MNPSNDALLRIEDVAEWLNLSVKTLRNMKGRGAGPKVTVLPSGSVRYTPAAVRDWIESGADR